GCHDLGLCLCSFLRFSLAPTGPTGLACVRPHSSGAAVVLDAVYSPRTYTQCAAGELRGNRRARRRVCRLSRADRRRQRSGACLWRPVECVGVGRRRDRRRGDGVLLTGAAGACGEIPRLTLRATFSLMPAQPTQVLLGPVPVPTRERASRILEQELWNKEPG